MMNELRNAVNMITDTEYNTIASQYIENLLTYYMQQLANIGDNMALEFKTGQSYADRVDNVYRFIGIVDNTAYFIDSVGKVVTRNPSGKGDDNAVSNQDIITHIVPVVKRKGFAYMFDKPVQTLSGYVLYGVIGKTKHDAMGYVNESFTVNKRDSVVAVTVYHK